MFEPESRLSGCGSAAPLRRAGGFLQRSFLRVFLRIAFVFCVVVVVHIYYATTIASKRQRNELLPPLPRQLLLSDPTNCSRCCCCCCWHCTQQEQQLRRSAAPPTLPHTNDGAAPEQAACGVAMTARLVVTAAAQQQQRGGQTWLTASPTPSDPSRPRGLHPVTSSSRRPSVRPHPVRWVLWRRPVRRRRHPFDGRSGHTLVQSRHPSYSDNR